MWQNYGSSGPNYRGRGWATWIMALASWSVSLIKPDWVITTVHCIDPKLQVSDYQVRLGDWHRFYYGGTEQVRNASKVTVHSQYHRPYPINNDIALIKLDRPTLLNSHVNTICLPQRGKTAPLNSTCYITGKLKFVPFQA